MRTADYIAMAVPMLDQVLAMLKSPEFDAADEATVLANLECLRSAAVDAKKRLPEKIYRRQGSRSSAEDDLGTVAPRVDDRPQR